MQDSEFKLLINNAIAGNINEVFKGALFVVRVQNHSIKHAFESSVKRDEQWGIAMSDYTATVAMLADFIYNGDQFIFLDPEWAYIVYLIAELKSISFINHRKELLIKSDITHEEINLIQRLDALREYLYEDAVVGYNKYELITKDLRKENIYVNPFSKSVNKSTNNSILVYKTYANELIGSTNKAGIENMFKSGGWGS